MHARDAWGSLVCNGQWKSRVYELMAPILISVEVPASSFRLQIIPFGSHMRQISDSDMRSRDSARHGLYALGGLSSLKVRSFVRRSGFNRILP